MKYVIISPVKNEEKFIKFTLNSIVSQTILPLKWIIVDDGSSDDTAKIVEEYSNKYPWIELLKLNTHKEERMGGSKVVRAFNAGFELVMNKEWEFLVKLDGDLTLPQDYFEDIINEFKTEVRLGICGGCIINIINNIEVFEGKVTNHVRGAIKSYRKECYNQIGGIKEVWNWDGLDEYEALYNDWSIKVIKYLKVIHHRPNNYNTPKYSFMSGVTAYKMNFGLSFIILLSISRVIKKPVLLGTYNFLKGYFWARLKNEKKIINKDFAKYVSRLKLQGKV